MNKSYKFRPNIVPNGGGKLILRKKHFNCWRRPFFFCSSPNFGEKRFNFRQRFFAFLVFIQFRRRNYVIFSKVRSHANCVWSRLPKRPPHAKFYNLSTGYKRMVARTRLAVLDNNFNVDRKRACTAIGSERWHLVGQKLRIVSWLRKFSKRKIIFLYRNSLNQLYIVSKIVIRFRIISVCNEAALAYLVKRRVSDRKVADSRCNS